MGKLVTYDLCKPGRDYTALYTAIKKYPVVNKLTESCWVIVSNNSAVEIGENLLQYMDPNDRLFVVDVANQGATWKNTICGDNAVKSLINA